MLTITEHIVIQMKLTILCIYRWWWSDHIIWVEYRKLYGNAQFLYVEMVELYSVLVCEKWSEILQKISLSFKGWILFNGNGKWKTMNKARDAFLSHNMVIHAVTSYSFSGQEFNCTDGKYYLSQTS